MPTALNSLESSYATSFGIEKVNSIKLEGFKPFFNNLPVDPYLKGGYRLRRLSHFQITEDKLIQLPHGCLFQSRDYNPVAGDIKREFEESKYFWKQGEMRVGWGKRITITLCSAYILPEQ